MAKTLAEQLRLIGMSLAHAASAGDFAAVAKWAAKAVALTETHAVPGLRVSEPMAPPVPLTYDQETPFFLDAQDKILIEKGRPHGREGAERGATTLAECIAICEALGLPLHLAEFESFIIPGTSQ